MKRFCISILSSLALVCATGAGAQAPAAPTAAAPQQAPVKARKICKSEATVGTRFETKICKTAEEWAAIQRRDRESLDDFRRSACMGGATSASSNGRGVSC